MLRNVLRGIHIPYLKCYATNSKWKNTWYLKCIYFAVGFPIAIPLIAIARDVGSLQGSQFSASKIHLRWIPTLLSVFVSIKRPNCWTERAQFFYGNSEIYEPKGLYFINRPSWTSLPGLFIISVLRSSNLIKTLVRHIGKKNYAYFKPHKNLKFF